MRIEATTAEVWIAVATLCGVLVTILSGFGWWMLRIDRGVQAIKSLQEQFQDFRGDSSRDREKLWSQLEGVDNRVTGHGERIAAVETSIGLRRHR